MTRTELLEKHRDINVHDDWWQPTYDAFADDMRLKGIRVDRMFFSGFSSQGDGACFVGHVDDWTVFLPTVGVTCPAVIALANEHWSLSVGHRGGRYTHEHSTHFDIYMPSPEDNGGYGGYSFTETPTAPGTPTTSAPRHGSPCFSRWTTTSWRRTCRKPSETTCVTSTSGWRRSTSTSPAMRWCGSPSRPMACTRN
jgi:hypothetical protein